MLPNRGTHLWQSMTQKGPSTASVRVCKGLKTILRQLQSFCKPISGAIVENLLIEPDPSLEFGPAAWADKRVPLKGFIVLAESPRVLGIPPGMRKFHEIAQLTQHWSVVPPHPPSLELLHQYVLEADRCRSTRAIGAHQTALSLLRKINIILNCQKLQVGLDEAFKDVQEAFEPQKFLECFPGRSEALEQLEKVEKDHSVATAQGTVLAESTKWNTVLLVPSGPTGWGGALEVARKLKFVKPDFPDLSDKITAIEIKREVVERRRGLLKVTEVQGRLSLVPAVTFKDLGIKDGARDIDYGPMVASEEAGSPSQHLKVYPFPEPGYDRRYAGVKTSWINFPDQQSLSSLPIQREELSGWSARSWLLRAELVQLKGSSKEDVASIENYLTKYRWFLDCLASFCSLRWTLQGKMLNVHRSFEELFQFPLSFFQTVALTLIDQLPGEGWQAEARSALEVLWHLKEDSTEENLYQAVPQVGGEDVDDDEDEDDQFEVPPELQPPLNPDYLELLRSGEGERVRVEQLPSVPDNQDDHDGHDDQPSVVGRGQQGERQGAPPVRQPAEHEQPQPRGRPGLGVEQDRKKRLPVKSNPARVAHFRAGSRSSSDGDNRGDGGGDGRYSPSATTASQVRGEDETHSIALQLQRSRQLLMTMTADPDSTKYRKQREKVDKMILVAEKHLRKGSGISESYGDFLVEEMTQAEDDCSRKDDELDQAEKRKKKVEGDKKDLLATLPRGLGQKFSGAAADYPAFRHYFVEINDSVSPALAVAHMTALVDCPKLKRRMKIYRSGDEVLADFDKDFGQSFLNCQTIINEINNLKRASNRTEEMELIVKFRHAKRTLDLNEDHEKLLNIPLMIQWSDQLLPSTCEGLLRIIQDADFGEQGSAVEEYFQYLERVYQRNSVLVRNRDSRKPPNQVNQYKQPGKRGGWVESDQRSFSSEAQHDDRAAQHGHKDDDDGRQNGEGWEESDQRSFSSEAQQGEGCPLCKKGQVHRPFNCELLKTGKISAKKATQAGLCTCCLAEPENCKKGLIKRQDGSSVYLTCAKCKKHKRLSGHQGCKDKQPKTQHGGSANPPQGPPVELGGDGSAGGEVVSLRTEMSVLVNPCSLGSALEMVDYALLLAPDGSKIKVRTIYDGCGTDCLVDWRIGDKFFHHQVPATVAINGATGTRRFASQVGELKLINADGMMFSLKAIKSDLSEKAFTLKRKFVDIPQSMQHHFWSTIHRYNEVGDLRHFNIAEDYQVQLVIGLDAVALSPMELQRGQDEHGQLVIWKSLISNQVLVTGSRKSGIAAAVRKEADQRSYVILEEGDHPVTMLRTAVDLGVEDTRRLFVKGGNSLSKMERKFFQHIEDSDHLVPPQPQGCLGCNGCVVCKDPFKARREETVIKLLDQLVTFKEGPREDKGGFHIKLIYDQELLARVPEGREAALRRLLSTERQLLKPNMEGALRNFNKKMEQCQERGYLVKPEDYKDLSHLQKSYQPVSFALKDEETVTSGQLPGVPEHKTKARPVIDSSSVAQPGGVSVNAAQYGLPDVHTAKISQLLIKLRTAKRFCIGDVSEFYFRIYCDEVTTSLTRILYREGGLGTQGKIIELLSPVASMGMKEISTFAAHVRYRVSLTIKDRDPVAAKQLRDSYCDDVTLFEMFDEGSSNSANGEHECTDGEILASRAKLVEAALNKAHLFLGDKWVTDAGQTVCGDTMVGVVTGGQEKEVALGNAKFTSALGYRLHLGPDQPSGGALLWRVHRPQSLNMEPKKRGARPAWAQLANSQDIREYLRTQGVSRASLLSLCSSLFDPLLLAAAFISTARQLFRKVLREVQLPSWRSLVPERYHGLIGQLAEDLLEVSKRLRVPRRAVVPSPVESEAHLHPYGFATLLIISDGSCEAGAAAAYIHQQFPFESGSWGPDADFAGVTIACNLLCAAVKLTDSKGANNTQVCGELLGKFVACQMKDFIVENVLIKFHQVRACSDSLTVEKAIRKTDACYSIWAGKRIAAIQRSLDLGQSWHVPHGITDATVDSCTKYQRKPSAALNEQWFQGRGVLDVPIQKLPFTARASYARPRIEDLPGQWLSPAAKTFLGLSMPHVVIMKLVVEEEVPELTLLEQMASKYQSVEKAISVLQLVLKMKRGFRELSVPAQREACLEKFVSSDYEKVSQQLGKRSTRLTQQLLLEEDKSRREFTLKGRFGYCAKLLASPKTSKFAQLVLRGAHNSNHLTSSARVLAKVGRQYVFTGGALNYLDKLRAECHMCRLLKPEAVKMLMGDSPDFMRGLLPQATTTWRYQSTDIFGPWLMQAFPRAKGTRGADKKIKTYGLLVFDYSSRAIDSCIIEDYSADSVIMGLNTIWGRVGKPQWLGFDAASNLAAATALQGGQEALDQPSLAEGERLQKEIQQRLGGRIDIRPRVPYAPWRQIAERGVQFCKRELRKMLQPSAGGLMTPLQASSILSLAVAHVNERPLVIHGSPDERGILTPWFLSARNMSTFHSQEIEDQGDLQHPLSRRAFQAQERLEMFKGLFNIFYHKEFVKLGRWRTQGKTPEVGDVCLVLDKTKGKAHFLQKFQLGRISSLRNNSTCEVAFLKQNPDVTAALIRDLRAQSKDWRKRYKVKTSTCTRDLKGLAIVSSQGQEKQLERGLEVDLLIERPQPGGEDGLVAGGEDDEHLGAGQLQELGIEPRVEPGGIEPRVEPEGIEPGIEPKSDQGVVESDSEAPKLLNKKKRRKEKWILRE